jgi:hypothetical protein
MERDTSPYDHEEQLDEIRRQLEFANPQALDALRQNTWDEANAAAEHALAGAELDTAARTRAEAMIDVIERADGEYEEYLDRHMDRAENPVLYDKVLELLKSSSVANIGNQEWKRGEQDEDGNFVDGTSGRLKAADAFDAICESVLRGGDGSDETTINPYRHLTETPEELEHYEALTDLKAARTALAELSVQRRRLIRKNSIKALELKERFAEAEEAYQAAYVKTGDAAVKLLQSQGKADDEIKASVAYGTTMEAIAFTADEARILEEDDSKFSRVAKWLGRKRNLFASNAATGFVMGYGTKKIIKGAAGIAVGPALPVALGIGAAVKTTKAVLNASVGNRVNQYKMHHKRAQEDIADITDRADGLNDGEAISDDDDLTYDSYDLLYDTISGRIEKDRKSNRNRVIAAGLIAGGTAVAGALLADAVDGGLFDKHKVPTGTGRGGGVLNGSTTPGAPRAPLPIINHDAYGFDAHATVEAGHGFTNELQDLVAQKGISLKGAHSYKLYEFLESRHGGNLFEGGHSYAMPGGDYGISNPGQMMWRPEVLHDIDEWLKTNSTN